MFSATRRLARPVIGYTKRIVRMNSQGPKYPNAETPPKPDGEVLGNIYIMGWALSTFTGSLIGLKTGIDEGFADDRGGSVVFWGPIYTVVGSMAGFMFGAIWPLSVPLLIIDVVGRH